MYKCPQSHCVPLRLVCDGWKDCSNGEDEQLCQDIVCPGLLRCRHDQVCVHPIDICDGFVHCLLSADDESLCHIQSCPYSCICLGYAIKCQEVLPNVGQISSYFVVIILRGISLPDDLNLRYNKQLRILNIIYCKFPSVAISRATFAGLFNVRSLRLTEANVHYLPNYIFSDLTNLKHLEIFNYKIWDIFEYTFNGLTLVQNLDLSVLHIKRLHKSPFNEQFGLLSLNLSYNQLHSLSKDTFTGLLSIEVIDLRHNFLRHIDRSTFLLTDLTVMLYFDQSYYCCYSGNNQMCFPNDDDGELCFNIFPQSWAELLNLVFSLSMLAVGGLNIALLWNQKKANTYTVLLIQLTISDSLLVLYVVVLSVMSNVNAGDYIYLNHGWRASSLCYVLRGIAIVSAIQSKLTSLLIVTSQLIAIRYVFRAKELLTFRNIQMALSVSWTLCMAASIAVVVSLHKLDNTCLPFVELSLDSMSDSLGIGVLLTVFFIIIVIICCMYYTLLRHVQLSRKRAGNKTKLDSLIRSTISVISVEIVIWITLLVSILCTYYSTRTDVKLVLISLVCYVPFCCHIVKYSGRNLIKLKDAFA